MKRTVPALLAVAALGFLGLVLVRAQSPARDDVYAAIRTNNLTRLRTLVRTAAEANAKDAQGNSPLMDAAAVGSIDAVTFLLGKGADVNAQNESGLSPLMLGATELAKEQALLAHGANVNATTKTGRSALFLAAMSARSAAIARLLIAKGADVKAVDAFKCTILSAATAGNDTDTIRIALDAGVDVNAASVTGVTPLMLAAAAGNVQAVKLLLAKGANVNAAGAPVMYPAKSPKAGPLQLGGYTPLLMAAAFGPPELLTALLDAGANVNASDSRKLTSLMLAAAADHQDPAIIRLLLARGADPNLKSAQGETAADWASKVGAAAGIELLHAVPLQPLTASENTAPLDIRTAVERSVALLERSSQTFYDGSGCISCHAQSITDLAVAEAKAKRANVDRKAAEGRLKMYGEASFPVDVLYQRLDIRVPEIVTYELAALAAAEYAPDRMTDASALNTAAQQSADGAWHYAFGAQQRPGGEDGDIFRTALAIRALKVYGPPGRGAEMQSRIASGRAWLQHAAPVTAEDRNMQLLGLYWAGATGMDLRPLARAILAAQQADGGWRQREGLTSDAYATGESLYALAKTGAVAPSDPAYQKGVRFLLATQRADDGSWRIRSRAPKFQVPFQSFPYAGDQWISQWGTGWAAMALAQAIEPARAAH